MTKISGALPKGLEDGLSGHTARLVKYPQAPIAVIAVLDVKSITRNLENGTEEPTLRILHIERILREDTTLAHDVTRNAFERRTMFEGEQQLPIDMRDELAALFDAVDADPRTPAEVADAEARQAAADMATHGVSVQLADGTWSSDPVEILKSGTGLLAEPTRRRGSRGKRGKGAEEVAKSDEEGGA